MSDATNDSELYTLYFINHAGLESKLTCINLHILYLILKVSVGGIFVVLKKRNLNGVMFFFIYFFYTVQTVFHVFVAYP